MKIIIIGCGKVGAALAQQLSHENHDICIIDLNRSRIEALTSTFDIMGIHGNGCDYSVLQEAGINNTDLVIAVTESDELNLLACVISHKVVKCQTIARVRNPVYENENSLLKQELGLTMIINPELWTAQDIFSVLCFPNAIEIDSFSKGHVQIVRYRVPADSVLNEMKVMDIARSLNSNILISCIENNDSIVIPNGESVVRSGDIISILCTGKTAAEFFKTIKASKNPVKNTMIIGGGKIAVYLSHMLVKAGIKVKIIEKNPKKCEELSALLPDVSVINGDGSDRELLHEERIEAMDSFVALTDFDEENILLSLYAQKVMNKKVVTKINRLQLNEVIYNLDLDSVTYPKNITTEKILQYVRSKSNTKESNIQTLFRLNEDKVEAIEFLVNSESKITGIPLSELNTKDSVIIACIVRNGKIIIPKGHDMILPGDSIVVVTTELGLVDVRNIVFS